MRIPVDTADDFVLGPLSSGAQRPRADRGAGRPGPPPPPTSRAAWASAYADALAKAPDGDPAKVATGDYGPVPALISRPAEPGAERRPGRRPPASAASFYQTTTPSRCCSSADGGYLEDQARGQHLGGDQWGMMNETGNYPGQAWLWLYTFWYQVTPFSTSDNADALVWGT